MPPGVALALLRSGSLSRMDFVSELTPSNGMKLFAARAVPAADVASDESDFPLPIADPSVPAMHRRCVLNGCSYRSGFLFAAGWTLAAVFLVVAVAIGFYGVNAQEALLRENTMLIEALRERTQPPVPAPSPSSARVGAPEPPPASASKPPDSVSQPPDSASPPPKGLTLPRRRSAVPKPEKEYTVPEAEKWWNRP